MPHNVEVLGLGNAQFPDEMDEQGMLQALRAKFEPVRQFGEQFFGGMSPLDKAALATAPVPILGDITGLAADIDMFIRDPESRTIVNAGLAAAGALPFVPSAAVLKAGKTAADALVKVLPEGRQFKTSSESGLSFIEGADGRLFKVRGDDVKDITGGAGEANIRRKLADIDAAGGLDAFESQSVARKAATKEKVQAFRDEAAEQGAGYRVQHQAPSIRDGSGVGGANVENAFPDIYGPNGLQFYGSGLPHDSQAINIIKAMNRSPNKAITIFRAVPKEVKDINAGDWVATTKKYAQDHAAGEEGWHILSKKVKPSEISTDGNSIHEWGFDPD